MILNDERIAKNWNDIIDDTDIGKEAGVAMEKVMYRQVSMEEVMELMETEENYIILDVRRREDVQ